MKSRLPYRPVANQQELKGVQTVRNLTSPTPVLEAVKDNLPETGKRTSHLKGGGT